MATMTDRREAVAAPKRLSARVIGLTSIAIGGIALILRLVGGSRSLDIFGDEVIYRNLGHSAHSGGLPTIDGHEFFLHPPGFFYLEAAWERLFCVRVDVVDSVYQMRTLNAVLAAGTAVVLVLLVSTVGSMRMAVFAGALFAVDPFCIRQNGRVLLETSTMFWVLIGYAALVPLLTDPARDRARVRAVGAGLLFGVAVLTKDVAALITVLPLLVAVALGWVPRRIVLLAIGTTIASYAAYVAVVAGTGHVDGLWDAKTTGAQRLLGLIQVTGFNTPGAPSLAGRLSTEMADFGATYVLLGLGAIALVRVLRRGSQTQRVLGLFHASAIATLGYAVVVGTLEEQALYMLLVPTLLTLAMALSMSRWTTLRTRIVASLVLVIVALNVATYLRWRLEPDDSYAQLRSYMSTHVPVGVAITSVDGTTESGVSKWVFSDVYRMGRWVSPEALAVEDVRYVIVPWKSVEQGYAYLTVGEARRLTRDATLVFSVTGSTYGTLALYEVEQAR